MKKPGRWRLSRKLLVGFGLLAVVPLIVVGLGIRQYTRGLLEQSFVQRAELTRRLVTAWNAQLEQRVREAVRRTVDDYQLQTALSARPPDTKTVAARINAIARETRVGGIDLIHVQPAGMLLEARSDEPTHSGFPVQAPETLGTMRVWKAPELGVQLYGLTARSERSPDQIVAAYFKLNAQLLSEIGEARNFLLGTVDVEGKPFILGDRTIDAWPDLNGQNGALVEVDLDGTGYTLGQVGPFRYGLSLADRYRTLHRLDLFLAIAIVLAVAVAMLAAWRVAVSAARPVEELAETVKGWGRGGSKQPLVTFAEGETATLVDAFEQLRRELAAAEKRLADAARAAGWQEMARKVAHEIKNPLTPIRITMDDLARRVQSDPDQAAAMIPEAARLVSEEVRALGRIVDAFSRYARLPEPHIASVGLDDVARDVAGLYASQAKVEVKSAGAQVNVQADAQLLREALTNLVKNAVEAAGAGGSVEVRVERERDRGTIAICDSGPGFPDSLLREGPRPYFTTKPEGTGLGLIVAHRIISEMDGRLELSNTERGARAVVGFPLAG